jgi:hypothetical protein
MLALDRYFRETLDSGGGGGGQRSSPTGGDSESKRIPRLLTVESRRPRPLVKLGALLEMGLPSQLANNICRAQSLDAS